MKHSLIKTLAVMLFLATALSANAQIGDYRNDFTIGFNGGVGLTSIGFVPKVTQGQLMGPRFGLSTRYVSEKYFKTVCSIRAELNYAQMGWKENIVDIHTKPVINALTGEREKYERSLAYIQMPVMAHLAWGKEYQGFNFFFCGGPQFGYLLSETTKTNFTTDTSNFEDRVNDTCAQDTMSVENKLDYGICAGIGVEYSHPRLGHFLLEGRYYYGLGNIYGASKSDYFAKSNQAAIEVKLSYLIDIKKTRKSKY